MNLFALLAIALGVAAVILFSALLAMADSHRRWRELAEELANDDIAAKLEKLCRYQIEYLARQECKTQQLFAAAIMMEPRHRKGGATMVIDEEESAP